MFFILADTTNIQLDSQFEENYKLSLAQMQNDKLNSEFILSEERPTRKSTRV